MSESPEVTQPPEVPLLDRLRELDRRIVGSVERVVRELHHELGERVRRSNQDLLRLVEELKPELPSTFLASDDLAPIAAQASSSAGRRAVHELLEAVGRVDAAATQADVLAVLLEEGRRFASRTAFFLTRAGVARGWAARGFDSDTAVESVEVEAGGLAALEELYRGHGPVPVGGADRTALGSWLEAPAGSEAVLIPFVLRGRLGGALYADRLDGGGLDVESLQLLTHSAALALETIGVRSPGVSPALRSGRPQEGAGEPLETWEPGAAAATASPAVAASVAVTKDAEPVAEPETAPAIDHAAVDHAAAETVTEVADLDTESPIAPIEDFLPEPEPVFEAPVFETPVYETPAIEEPGVEEASIELAEIEAAAEEVEPELGTQPELTAPEAFLAEEPVAEEVDLFEPATSPSPTFAEPELEDYGVAEPELEDYGVTDYGVTAEKPTREAMPEADLWPAEEDEMPAVDFAPAATEVPPIEPAPIELVEDTPELEEPEIAYPDFPVGQQTVRLDVSAFQTPTQPPKVAATGSEDPTVFHSTAEVPTWEVEEPTPAAEPAGYELDGDETNAYEPITEAVPTTPPAVSSEDPTILGSRASLGLAPPPAAPLAAAPPPAASSGPELESDAEQAGSTQVQPPSDIRGPGLAFAAGGGAAGHEALHEEARRLARLLVSEIKLYNEEIIEEGKREGNIYDRLRDDIDRSRQMYEERIDPRIRGNEDYFYQELVQRLAGGDPRLLGM